MRDVYGAKTEKAQSLRFHTQTAGVSLTAQHPTTTSCERRSRRWPRCSAGERCTPTRWTRCSRCRRAKAAQIALRTQQVIAEETGVLNVADPLGGSWYVEALTDRIEAEAEAIFARIKELGGDGTMTAGLLRGIEDGWFIGEIADSAFAYQVALEKGEKRVVGVNTLTGDMGDELEILRISHEVELRAARNGRARRGARTKPPSTRRWVGWSRPRRPTRTPSGDAGRSARRGDPGRDLQRVQADVGRLPGAGRF